MVFFVFSVGLMMMEVVDRVRRISLDKINLEKGRMILEASDGRKHLTVKRYADVKSV